MAKAEVLLDAGALEAALERYDGTAEGTILLLAWRAGLSRREIWALRWSDVDADAGLLHLPDREVPLDAYCVESLERWQLECGPICPYVAASARRQRRLAASYISRISRAALDGAGLKHLSLRDLRYDYIRRQYLLRGWNAAVRLSGLSMDGCREVLGPLRPDGDTPPDAPAEDRGDDAFRVWRIMQTAPESAVRVSLWLLRQMGLNMNRIVNLTWEDVDLEKGTLRLPEGERELPRGVRRVLAEEKARRSSGDDPHLILSPRARRPIDPTRLSKLLHTALLRGGVEDLRGVDIRLGSGGVEERLLAGHAREQGSVTTAAAAALLNVSDARARGLLKRAAEKGVLVRVGSRYYPPEHAVPQARQRELVLALARTQGVFRCQHAAEALGIPSRQAGRLLQRMEAEGLIVRLEGTKRYRACEPEELNNSQQEK